MDCRRAGQAFAGLLFMSSHFGLSLVFHLFAILVILPAQAKTEVSSEDNEVEEISAELAKKIEMPKPAQEVPGFVLHVSKPMESKEEAGEVLWSLASPFQALPPPSAQVEHPSRNETKMSAQDAELTEARVRFKKDNKDKGLPESSPHTLSPSKLAKLCAGLTEPNPHTMDAVANSRLSNFRVQAPLVIRVGQMESITNVEGDYVILVPAKGKSPEVELLKGIRKPYVLCGVRARKLEDVTSPVVFVGVKAPKIANKNTQQKNPVRSIASERSNL